MLIIKKPLFATNPIDAQARHRNSAKTYTPNARQNQIRGITEKRLTPQESDRVYRVAAAYRIALQLFESNAEAARHWLNEPAKALKGSTPLQHLDTEAGADEVRDLIGRLEQGVIT